MTIRCLLAMLVSLWLVTPACINAAVSLGRGDMVMEGTLNFCADVGTTDAYACEILGETRPALSAYNVGTEYKFRANTDNTGVATINFNGLGAKTIKKAVGGVTTDLADGDIRAGQMVSVMWDGTNMQIVSLLGNAAATGPGGGASIACSAQFVRSTVSSGACASVNLVSDVTGILPTSRGSLGLDASGIAKGGLVIGTAANTFGIKLIGTDGFVLTADAASAGGMKWAAGGGGGGGSGTVTNAAGLTTNYIVVGAGSNAVAVSGVSITTGGGGGLVLSGSTSGSVTATVPAVAGTVVGNLATTTGALTTNNCAKFNASGQLVDHGSTCGGGGSSAFNALTSGTNTTAAMVVGSGGSLTYSGSGTINALTVKGQAVGAYWTKTVSPTTADNIAAGYLNGDQWVDTTANPNTVWYKTKESAGVATWVRADTGGLNNYWTKTVSPTTAENTAAGYITGDQWVDTTASPNTVWFKTKESAGTATWIRVDNGGITGTGTVTSVATTGPITGGTITATGTIACATCVTSAAVLADTKVVVGSGGAQGTATSSLTATVTKMTAGVPSAATVATDYGSPDAATKTLTNTTFNAESTGNVLTVPVVKFYPAAGCNNVTATSVWDLPATTPAVPTCVTGTNITKGILLFADSGPFSAQITDALPSDWLGTGAGMSAKIYWTTTATSGNAKWTLYLSCTDVAASTVDDVAFNSGDAVTTAAPGTASRVQTSAIAVLSSSAASCTSDFAQIMHMKIFRDGTDGADTIGQDAKLIGVELTYRRAM